MKIKYHFLLIPCVGLGIISSAYGLGVIGGGNNQACDEITCTSGTEMTQTSMNDPNCRTTDINSTYWTRKCYKDQDGALYSFRYCNSCLPGYTFQNTGVNPCNQTGIVMYIQFPICQCICNNCTSDTDWSAGNTGYQRRMKRLCNCSSGTATCESKYEYRCVAGYWGTSSNGTSGCSPCPGWSGVYTNSARTTNVRGTSSVGTTEITGCYVASGTYYDATGTFKTNGNCPYKQ